MSLRSEDRRKPSPLPTRKERERARRQGEILAAAERVFTRTGFHAATMQEIAHESEFAVGTLYGFFPSKEALLAGFIETHLEEIVRGVRSAVEAPAPSGERLRAVVGTVLAFFESHRSLFGIYLQEVASPGTGVGGLGQECAARRYGEALALVERLVAGGIRDGTFRKVDRRVGSVALMGLIDAFVEHWIRTEPDRPLSDRRDTVVDLYLHGVGA